MTAKNGNQRKVKLLRQKRIRQRSRRRKNGVKTGQASRRTQGRHYRSIHQLKKKFFGPIPATMRHCTICGKERKFRFQRNLGHSACVACGSRYNKPMGAIQVPSKAVQAIT